ncbi:ammonium transporter AmtB-like domain-containing protein [Fimicolochytrium jonesii]|uniref:ammonium transporter AmtB-like domain-containing protein n=1 Tax=Fimicolochytrium jonesii TaxID=1396493 RepID=UPI0022FE3950|nr:ammonium transporter AmtB-like domain-containing protein [Fimicolochytrium jonesii]KAI8820964.1 ammonium transporter AmtB-like domain-containing protein [Fimicolochytrium jonesii]
MSSLNLTDGTAVTVAGTAFQDPLTNAGATPFVEHGYASTGFIIICTALVFFMTPGLGLFYAGLSRVKNSLSLIMISMLAMSIITIQWVLFGFSLSFSETGGRFWGNLAHGGLKGLGADALPLTAPTIPGILFALYQMQFATITAALIFGSVAERIRLLPAMLFILLWSTFVYNPVAYWTWSARGWLKSLSCIDTIMDTPCGVGALDFAGGGPVHIASGFAGLAYCLMAGKRKLSDHEPFKAHNMTNVFLGVGLLWFGWYGFNAGSAVGATPRAAMAGLVTTLAAASGSLSWMGWDFFRHGKLSGLGYCSGAVAGLVGITPASGFVAPWAAIIIGAASGVCCNMACRLKDHFGFDDSLDAWGVHGIGGIVGGVLTGFFAQQWVAALDGGVIAGGAVDGNWKQIGYQLAGCVTIAAWSFFLSLLILFILNKIPGLHIRPGADHHEHGNDMSEMGEVAYEIMMAKENATAHSSMPAAPERTLSKAKLDTQPTEATISVQ